MKDQTVMDMVTEFALAMEQPLGQPIFRDFHRMERGELTRADLNKLYSVDQAERAYALIEMRLKLIHEEMDEFVNAPDFPNAIKELADLVYVIYGFAATFGIDLDLAVRRVHASNMSKLGDDVKPIKREDGKVLKSHNYKPPVMDDLCE